MIKNLNFLLIIILITSIGCASIELKEEKRAGFDFVDSSNGLPLSGQWRHGIAFYDINEDGYIDILAPPPRQASKGYEKPLVWYGNGGKEWRESRLDVPSEIGYNYGGIAVSDFDGDMIPDIALAMHCLGLKILKGTGNGKYEDFSDGIPPANKFVSRALISADFNNDGISDIAAVSEAKFGKDFPPSSGLRICYSSGNTWRCSSVGEEKDVLGLYADQLIVGDVNGDGNKDIAVASLIGMRNLIVWLGDGKGGFKPFNVGLPQRKIYLSVALGDIDRDGRDDLVVSMTGIGIRAFKGLKVFLSGPDAFEEMSEGLPSEEVFTSVRVCDMNGDGSVEIVAATGQGGLKIFSRQGSAWHEVSASGLPKKGLFRIYNLYCIDLNGDGRKDIALNYSWGQNNSGGIRVFLNVPDRNG
jgi:hypothetical protein